MPKHLFLLWVIYLTLYHDLAIYTEVTFVNVTLVEAASSGGGLAIVSVSYPKLGLKNTGNIELGAAPLVQYYSVFSSRPILGYGTLIHYTTAWTFTRGLHLSMLPL